MMTTERELLAALKDALLCTGEENKPADGRCGFCERIMAEVGHARHCWVPQAQHAVKRAEGPLLALRDAYAVVSEQHRGLDWSGDLLDRLGTAIEDATGEHPQESMRGR